MITALPWFIIFAQPELIFIQTQQFKVTNTDHFTFCGFGMYIVGISKPHLLRPGRRHSSWTICIITLWWEKKKVHLTGSTFFETKINYTNQVNWPVCLSPSRLHLPCWGRTTACLRIFGSASPRCWACVCKALGPSGQRTQISGLPVLLLREKKSIYYIPAAVHQLYSRHKGGEEEDRSPLKRQV